MINFVGWLMPTRSACAPSMLNFHPHVRGRQLRLEALPRQADRHRRDAGQGHRQAREVHGGPRRQPPRLRRAPRERASTSPSWRWTPTARSAACASRSSTTTAPTSMFGHRAATPTRCPRSPARTGSAASTTTSLRADQQVPAGRASAARARTPPTWCWSAWSTPPRGAAASTPSSSAGATSSRPTRSPSRCRPATSTTRRLPGGARPRAQHGRLDRLRPSRREARARGPLHRHRRGTAPAAQRLLRHRVLVPLHRRRPPRSRPRRASDCAVGPTGEFIVTMFSPFWGNCPETVVAQTIAEEFGIDPARSRHLRGLLHGLPERGPRRQPHDRHAHRRGRAAPPAS